MTDPNADRRRYQRGLCSLPIELRSATSSFPVKAETTDVSVGGCYVRLLYPFAVGTPLEISLWIDGAKMQFGGKIIFADAGVGNGIEFFALTDEQVASLKACVAKAQSPPQGGDTILR